MSLSDVSRAAQSVGWEVADAAGAVVGRGASGPRVAPRLQPEDPSA
jgi:hypothetical protein